MVVRDEEAMLTEGGDDGVVIYIERRESVDCTHSGTKVWG
jgi:hypothetical protein